MVGCKEKNKAKLKRRFVISKLVGMCWTIINKKRVLILQMSSHQAYADVEIQMKLKLVE